MFRESDVDDGLLAETELKEATHDDFELDSIHADSIVWEATFDDNEARVVSKARVGILASQTLLVKTQITWRGATPPKERDTVLDIEDGSEQGEFVLKMDNESEEVITTLDRIAQIALYEAAHEMEQLSDLASPIDTSL